MLEIRGLVWMTLAWAGGVLLESPTPKASTRANRPTVALTFDDLPSHATLPPGMSRVDVARSVLAALKAHHAPPTYGFVNAKSLGEGPDNAEVLRLWRGAGHPLGNHTFSHMDLDANSAEAFARDVLANEPALRELMGDADWHWLRFPYLRAGDTPEKQQTMAAFLKDHGYQVAEVTMSFDDYAYNDPYARCLAENDRAAIDWMEESYLRRAGEALARGPQAARLAYGHDIGHVMLLHIGGFQTVMLPRLLDLIERRGFRLVTLAEAQRDPVYAMAPDPASPGASLLRRLAAAKALPPSTSTEEALARLAGLCR
jgi:peptidoglycan-N-acetylglucosamine deacetylase